MPPGAVYTNTVRTALVLLVGLLPVVAQDEKVEKGSAKDRLLRPSADPELQKILARYEFAEREFPWTLKEHRQNDKYTQYWLSFPSALNTTPSRITSGLPSSSRS